MIRTRALFISILIGSSSVLLLAGCSGKPENSPAIRKKFAEVDKMQENMDNLVAETAMLSEQVRRLTEENSELRAFLPDVDGTPAIEKISTLESRLNKLESLTADKLVASATQRTSTSQNTTPAPTIQKTTTTESEDLETASLAGAPPQEKVAAQREAPTEQAAEKKTVSPPKPSSSFKEKTNPNTSSETTKKTETKSKPAPVRGKYYTIQVGESIQDIATKHNTTVDAIMKANRLPAGARLARGQRLFIPGS